jgi:hypothetical protein
MLLHTPDDLGVKLIVASELGRAFALCHPGLDGPPDLATSVVIQVDAPDFEVVRVFDTEIVSMVALEGALYCVDRLQHVYIYSDGGWNDIGNPSLRPYRINDLRVVNGEVHGIGNDRMIFVWRANSWIPITEEKKKLYLYDVADWGANGYIVSGEAGFLATLKDRTFDRIALPTNVDITGVLPLSADRILATGWDSTVLIVGLDEIQIIDAEAKGLNFLNAVRWNSKTLIAAEDEILELKDNVVEIFAPERATLLSTVGERLWRQGADGIAYLDPGANWVPVPLSADL